MSTSERPQAEVSTSTFAPLGTYRLWRPFLFRLAPERTHHLSLKALEWASRFTWGSRCLAQLYAPRSTYVTPRSLWGHTVQTPLGLAAGYDKGARALEGLTALGFGHIEVGTVTPRPQHGNSGVRVKRLKSQRALVNRLGFPSEGMEVVAQRLEHFRRRREEASYAEPTHSRSTPMIGVNLGKNRSTPNHQAHEDYLKLIKRLGPYADYVVVNISSPNTPQLRALQERDALSRLLDPLLNARETLSAASGSRLPLVVKLAPEFREASLEDTLQIIIEANVDGVILANTQSVEVPLSGGLSGAPLFDQTLRLITQARAHAPHLTLIASGGIGSRTQVDELLSAGADLIQVWTALVYRGPRLVRELSEVSS